ncbi:MAG TPA: molybdopterin-dependent oxidoreductase [Bryobacteraceae bacterium]
MPERKGLNLMEMMDAAEQGHLKAMWCIGYDILLTNPNASATRRALGSMDAVVVQDIFLNETAREFGTVFFPACSSFEKDGTFMNAERRIQRIRKALPQMGESRTDWEIICQLAKAMGRGNSFSYSSPADIWEEIRTLWPAGAGITYQRLEHNGLQWPCPDENHAGTAILHQDSFPFGKRTSLHCAKFKQSPETATNEYPFILTSGRTLQQFNAGTMTRHGGHKLLRPTDALDISSTDAEVLRVGEGDRVRLRSRYGETTLPIHITNVVSQGELFATFHDAASRLNAVTSPLRDAETSTPEYKITAVKLEKMPPEDR